MGDVMHKENVRHTITNEIKQKLKRDIDSVIMGGEKLNRYIETGAEASHLRTEVKALREDIEKLKQSKEILEWIPVVAETSTPSISYAESVQNAQARGEARLVDWTRDGTLIDSKTLADLWGITRQALDAARNRGEVFSLWVKGQHWYPGELGKFERTTFARINEALGDLDPSSKLVFLLHKHGALKGRTPADADGDMLDDIIRLAGGWSRD